MNKLYLFGVLFFFATVFLPSEGKYYLLIDNFQDRGVTINFNVPTDAPDGYWWNPYAFQPGRYPDSSFTTSQGALGGQRDVIVGWEGFSNAGATCTANVVTAIDGITRKGNVGMSLNFVGGVYFQYDGPDSGGATGLITGAGVLPGAIFNFQPGLGSFTHTPDYPERNGDGRTYDFTSGGKAVGFTVKVEADWQVFYYIDVLDFDGFNNSMQFLPPEDVETTFFFRFDDPAWITNKPSAWDWTKISGLQVRVWVFSDSENPGQQGSQAVDSTWYSLRTFGLEVTGTVEIDCDCTSSPDQPASNVEVSISQNGGPVIASDFTDGTGTFSFAGPFLNTGTYQVCIVDASISRCSNTPQCKTVTITDPVTDPAALVFYVVIDATLIPPAPVTIQCGECQTVTCLGSATLTDCAGNNVPVTTATDGPRTGTCASASFVRTFTAQGLSVTQTITIIDNASPTITTPASDASVQCANGTPSLTTWLQTAAGAIANDCSGFLWTNDYNNAPLSCSGVTVTFVATDPCGNPGTPTTATYTASDVTAPSITTQATSPSSTCNANGSDLAAFNAWLSSNGGAVVSDNCGPSGLTWSNNYVPGSMTSGCLSTAPVVFTVTDACGNAAQTTAIYTIQDNAGPTINPQASPRSVACTADITTEYNNWLAAHGGASASDVCSGNTLTWTNDAPAGAPSGCSASSTVTFTVADGCGNLATTTSAFTVVDQTAPVITTQPTPLSVDCTATDADTQLQNWVNNNGGAVANDVCSSIAWTNSFTPGSGSCSNVPVTFTVTDACNNAARVTSTYSITDTSAPVITVGSQTVDCANYTPDQFTAWLGAFTVSDNCAAADQIQVSHNYTSSQPPAAGCNVFVVVAWTARDVCGNVSPASTASYQITDSTPPTLTTPAVSESVPCGSTANTQYTTWLNNRGGATATDSCGAVSWTHDGPATPTFDGCNGATPVTWTIRDSCGATITTSATFAITDSEGPTLAREAAPLSEECSTTASTTLTSWLASNGGAQATDNCSPVVWTNDFVTATTGCNAVTPVTFTASDRCGFSVSTSTTYSNSDTTPPVVTPARDMSAPCNADTHAALLAWAQNHGGATATDRCAPTDQLVWAALNVPPIVGCNFAAVTFTVSDPCGNSASTTATFTSTDSTAPGFNPAATDATAECDGAGNAAQYQAWLDDHAGARATDDCALSFTWTHNGPASAPTTCGAITVTFSVTDSCSNTARTTAAFRVNDTQPPTFTTPPTDTNNECDGAGNTAALTAWLANNAGAQATDICTTSLTWSNAAQTPTGDGCTQVRPYAFSVRDSCGNTATLTANFILGDTTPPVWECPVEDVEFECDGFGNEGQIQGWLNNNGGGHVVDLCYGEQITWTNDFPGSVPMCSSVTVNFVASDPCGNSVSDSGVVAIVDTQDPTWSFFPEDVTLTCDADVSVAVLGAALATDVCSGDLFVSLSESEFDEPADGDCPGDHIITRTWSAVDECGNSITRDQVITVEIIRSSGPCEQNCVCDDCCPPPVPADCLPSNCQSADCSRVPCNAAPCSCGNNKVDVDSDDSIQAYDAKLVESLPQCKPVYIYVNDDDDSEKDVDSTGLERQRMLVTNEPLHESVLKSKSDSSTLSYSVFALVFALALFFF